MDLLDGFTSAEEAKGFLTDPDVRWGYRRGNFFVADAESAWHAVWDKKTDVRRLSPGGHVVTTLTMFPGVKWTERAENIWVNVEKRRVRALQLLDGLQPGNVDGLVSSLREVSADQGAEKGPGSICYHYPARAGEYVQTSSTIIALGSDVSQSSIHYCYGNHCENEYNVFSPIISGQNKRTFQKKWGF